MDRFVRQFFDLEHIRASLPAILDGFWLNIQMMLVAEVAVLVWALVLALLRTAPGLPGLPLRVLAVVYIDFFRGVPMILVIYLIVFGLPFTGIPAFQGASAIFPLAVLALTLVYGAYVAEVYRSGIDGVHWSQTAASRSLGLSYAKTMRFVVLPQAIRRVIPPLLNDFIGLQKDTALAATVGIVEGFRQAFIYAGANFNVSSLIGVSLAFVVITVPLARLVDLLIARDRRRQRALV
ncbi:MAG: amino acid ABC transporter permease [Chloroflexi bacterium]|nr:amino acid ABC transporter permease [Chloroflexota bacterium]